MGHAKPVFSRKALNIIIFFCMVLVLVFSQLWKEKDEYLAPLADQEVLDVSEASASSVKTEQQTSPDVDYFFPELKGIPAIPVADLDFTIKKWTTKNGMKVMFRQNVEIPMLDIRFIFRAGSTLDSLEKQGLAGITAALNSMSLSTKITRTRWKPC